MADTSIKAIGRTSVHKITSGQVVVDLQTAVKELLENALDAGATNIEVRFKQYGLSSIEVVDNGTGIAPEDYESIALKHHTSKLSSYSDLTTVTTFGFRGEALSSLCALSREVAVTTARTQEEPVGVSLEFAKTGKLSKQSKIARQRGTTVIVSGLFQPLPVRRKELERNIKREFAKVLNLLNAYALIPCTSENKGVRLTVNNQAEGGRKTVQLQTDGTPSIRSAITSLWGPKSLNNIDDLDISFEVEPDKIALRRLSALGENAAMRNIQVRARGLVSKFAVGCGRTGTDRQYFYVNGRPCNLAKVQKAFNEVYRTFSANQSPFLIVDLIMPTVSCDVNVSPDKRTIFLHSETQLLDALKTSLETTFAPSRSTFNTNLTQSLITSQYQPDSTINSSTEARNLSSPLFIEDESMEHEDATFDKSPQSPVAPSTSNISMDDGRNGKCPQKGMTDSRPTPLIPHPTSTSSSPTIFGAPSSILSVSTTLVSNHLQSSNQQGDQVASNKSAKEQRQTTLDEVVLNTTKALWNQKAPISNNPILNHTVHRSSLPATSSRHAHPGEPPHKKRRNSIVIRHKDAQQTMRTRLSAFAREGSVMRPQFLDTNETSEGELEAETDMDIDLGNRPIEAPSPQEITDLTTLDSSQETTNSQANNLVAPELIRVIEGGDVTMRFDLSHIATIYGDYAIPVDQPMTPPLREDEGEALLRIIDKEDFAQMQIMGQFNLGFIVARRRKGVEDDLFIVDQHAADEKYNFETLQETTRIQSQRLIRPQPLELTAADELLAQGNIEVLTQNGFEVVVDEEAAMGRKLKLVAQPISKNTVFDMKDLEELIHLMADKPTGQLVRCSKARAMFAMRACRKSIMVGKALNLKQMITVIRHMGTMDQPWNCPHGRPTMRHLLDINTVADNPQHIDWTNFGVKPALELEDLTLNDL